MSGETRREKSLRIGVHHADAVVWEPVYRTHPSPPRRRRSIPGSRSRRSPLSRPPPRPAARAAARTASRRTRAPRPSARPPRCSRRRTLARSDTAESRSCEVRFRDGGVELKGVRSGVERRRGVSGLKPRDPGRREANAGRESPQGMKFTTRTRSHGNRCDRDAPSSTPPPRPPRRRAPTETPRSPRARPRTPDLS